MSAKQSLIRLGMADAKVIENREIGSTFGVWFESRVVSG